MADFVVEHDPYNSDCHYIKRRYGTAGVVSITLAWIAFLTFIFIFVLDLGFVGSLLYGSLVMGGVLFIARNAV